MKQARNLIILLNTALLTLIPVSAWSQSVALSPGDKYAALGSSFAAGPGIDNQLGSCGRSDNNYSHLVAEALDLDLTLSACNGATIDHVADTPQGDNPLQIESVTSDTKLITVTMGGNDIRYTSSTFACSGTPASERCTANLDQAAINTAIEGLPAKLERMYDNLKARAPDATIVLVAYPRVFPEDAVNCSELELSPEDTRFLADMGERLEAAFVESTSGGKALIADAYVRAAGHGPCSTGERWINGATIASSGTRYHPTAEAHQEMARLVLEALGQN